MQWRRIQYYRQTQPSVVSARFMLLGILKSQAAVVRQVLPLPTILMARRCLYIWNPSCLVLV